MCLQVNYKKMNKTESGVGHRMFKSKLPASMSRRVVNSLTRRVGESLSDKYSTIGKKYH
jgi:hypothetical protein